MAWRTFGWSVCASMVVFGCSYFEHPSFNLSAIPLSIAVGPVALDAAITKSTQIHTFKDTPQSDIEPAIRAMLLDETRTIAQRMLTSELSQQSRFAVVPFEDTRRAQPEIASPVEAWTHDQLLALGKSTGADVVVDAHILDYGVVRWQYWVTGWLTHASVATTLVGIASAWNPAAIGVYLAVDASTDLPIWWGGAQVFGWAFRPVRVQVDAVQVAPCEGLIWSQQELVVKVPGKELAGYSPEDQTRKEVQLEVNLRSAMASLANSAAESLARQPCDTQGRPQKVTGFSLWKWLDLLH